MKAPTKDKKHGVMVRLGDDLLEKVDSFRNEEMSRAAVIRNALRAYEGEKD